MESNVPAAAVVPEFDSPASISVVVNKDRPLDAGYVPPDLIDAGGVLLRAEAGHAYLRMSAGAAEASAAITAVSGFRPANMQADLHSSYTDSYGGPAAEALSARPGHSEHQTGLAVDIANPDGACSLQSCFDGTPAGSWAAGNGHRYGFVVRYPAGAEAITGYSYEPWHLRYVGEEMARQMFDAGITLEEFADLPAAPGY
ncbi:M15 family metallopeptidase [Arthrobacter sp. ATA002]|uniref:M15 family metallopeptidase n=1 Tax=Arthrobacter sp. ATA002 TaxID=2991715 RepID=UPI0022A7E7A0|nr:M15 family metallopeptidase [Arthrobacter sp. ATA002]WAP53047.1 M15 family metallopeptidase [Arthrobacter sp. ATA002]